MKHFLQFAVTFVFAINKIIPFFIFVFCFSSVNLSISHWLCNNGTFRIKLIPLLLCSFMHLTLNTNCKTSSRLIETTLWKPNKHSFTFVLKERLFVYTKKCCDHDRIFVVFVWVMHILSLSSCTLLQLNSVGKNTKHIVCQGCNTWKISHILNWLL